MKKYSNKPLVGDLISILVESGLKHVVVSPGSRNAPISYSFVEHPDVTVYSVPDERVAGYMALGMCQMLEAPVAVVCTSGTAAYNYGPAVAEACYQKNPLIILTADRPEEWIAQGEGQTIFQKDIFGKHVLFSAQLNEDHEDKDLRWHNIRRINEAWEICTTQTQGPVHLNIGLREPLYQFTDELPAPMIKRTMQMEHRMTEEQWETLRKTFNSKEKVLIVLTQNGGVSANKYVDQVSRWNNVLTFSETTSNVHATEVVSCIDRFLESLDADQTESLKPDLVVTIGHNIISKKLRRLLRNSEAVHWHVDETDRFLDTFQKLELTIPVTGDEFFNQIAHSTHSSESTYHSHWIEHEKKVKERHARFLETCSYSDMKVFEVLLSQMPEHIDLQMGNSSVVRYIQLYDARPDLRYFGNRGTSGIDGCTSTAIGAAIISQKPTYLISGDIAFFYDSNAFWHDHLPKNFKAIVINNGGGGIFRIIPGPKSTNALDPCFETPHHRTAEHIAKAHQLQYYHVKDLDELQDVLIQFHQATQPSILEIFTPRERNDQVLQDYFSSLK